MRLYADIDVFTCLVECFHDAADVALELRVVGRQGACAFIEGRPRLGVNGAEIVKDTKKLGKYKRNAIKIVKMTMCKVLRRERMR